MEVNRKVFDLFGVQMDQESLHHRPVRSMENIETEIIEAGGMILFQSKVDQLHG